MSNRFYNDGPVFRDNGLSAKGRENYDAIDWRKKPDVIKHGDNQPKSSVPDQPIDTREDILIGVLCHISKLLGFEEFSCPAPLYAEIERLKKLDSV